MNLVIPGSADVFRSFGISEIGPSTRPLTASLTLDLDESIARDNGAYPVPPFNGRATRVAVDLLVGLDVYALSGSSARIGLNDVDGITITTIVPEPTAAFMMGPGLFGLTTSDEAGVRRSIGRAWPWLVSC